VLISTPKNPRFPMAKNEKTGKKVASIAGKKLANPKTSPDVKKIAASALTQAPDRPKKKKK
jgi:hypothetical protein